MLHLVYFKLAKLHTKTLCNHLLHKVISSSFHKKRRFQIIRISSDKKDSSLRLPIWPLHSNNSSVAEQDVETLPKIVGRFKRFSHLRDVIVDAFCNRYGVPRQNKCI